MHSTGPNHSYEVCIRMFPRPGIAGVTFRVQNVWSISLPRRIAFLKDDLDNTCYSACHLYHEIPRLEPRKPPRKLSHTSSRTRGRWGELLGGKPYGNLKKEQLLSVASWRLGQRRRGPPAASPRPQSQVHQLWMPSPESHPGKLHQITRKALD